MQVALFGQKVPTKGSFREENGDCLRNVTGDEGATDISG